MKKEIVYRHIEKDKKLTTFDYLMDYDGNWLFKKIDYDILYNVTKDENILLIKKRIELYQKIYILIFIAILTLSILFKIKGII